MFKNACGPCGSECCPDLPVKASPFKEGFSVVLVGLVPSFKGKIPNIPSLVPVVRKFYLPSVFVPFLIIFLLSPFKYVQCPYLY